MKLAQFISLNILSFSAIASTVQLETATPIRTQQRYDEILLPDKYSVTLSPDRRYFCVQHADLTTLSLYDCQTGLIIYKLKHEEVIPIEIFTDDNRYFLSASEDGELKLIDLQKRREIASILCDRASYQQWFSAQNRYLFVDDGEGELMIFETESGKLIRMIRYTDKLDHSDFVRDVLFSADGTRAVVATNRGFMGVVQLSNGQVLHSQLEKEGIFKIAVSSDKKYIAMPSKNIVKIFRLDDLKFVKSYKFRHNISEINFLKSNNFIIICDYNKQVLILNLSTGAIETHKHNHSSTTNPIIFSPDERSFVVRSEKDSLALFHNAKRVATLKKIGDHYEALFSPDSKMLLYRGADKVMQIYDTQTGKILTELPSSLDNQFSNNSSFFAFTEMHLEESDSDFVEVESPKFTLSVNLISTKTFQLVHRSTFQGNVKNILFTPDNKSLIIESDNILRTVYLP